MNIFEKKFVERIYAETDLDDIISNEEGISVQGVAYTNPYDKLMKFHAINYSEAEAIFDVGEAIYGDYPKDNWKESYAYLADKLLEIAESDLPKEAKIEQLGTIAYMDLKQRIVEKYGK